MHATLREKVRPIDERLGVGSAYLKLMRKFPLRRITTEEENGEALVALRQASPLAEKDDTALEYYNVLAFLIEDFERRTYNFDTSHITTADLVRFKLEERGLSISQLARDVKMTQSNLSEMLNGKRAWSKSAIRKLSAHLNISAERFLREEKKR